MAVTTNDQSCSRWRTFLLRPAARSDADDRLTSFVGEDFTQTLTVVLMFRLFTDEHKRITVVAGYYSDTRSVCVGICRYTSGSGTTIYIYIKSDDDYCTTSADAICFAKRDLFRETRYVSDRRIKPDDDDTVARKRVDKYAKSDSRFCVSVILSKLKIITMKRTYRARFAFYN